LYQDKTLKIPKKMIPSFGTVTKTSSAVHSQDTSVGEVACGSGRDGNRGRSCFDSGDGCRGSGQNKGNDRRCEESYMIYHRKVLHHSHRSLQVGVVLSSETHMRMSGVKDRGNQSRNTTSKDTLQDLQVFHHPHREATSSMWVFTHFRSVHEPCVRRYRFCMTTKSPTVNISVFMTLVTLHL